MGMERKGFVFVFLECQDGQRNPVMFIDHVRLVQDVESTLQSGQPYYYELGQVVVPEVTIPTLTKIIPHLVEEGYLESHLPLHEPTACNLNGLASPAHVRSRGSFYKFSAV
jgi:hypothetical protein